MAAAAAPYEQVMQDMRKGRELAARLQGLLRDSPEAGRLVDQILNAMSRTIETAKAAAAAEEGSEGQSEVTCAGSAGGGGKRKAAGGGDKRSTCRRRAQNSSTVTVTIKDIEDGHAWRKYGQKEIQNSKHPKAYFRCTHKYDQQCAAQRQVQRCDDDPDAFRVTYIGVHTCRDPASVAPVVLHSAGIADELHAGSHLISFAPNASATTSGNTSQQTDQKDAALLAGLRPLKLEAVGGSGEQEEVLSSLTPAGSSAVAEAMRNAAATPGPDQGDVTSGLQHCYGDGFADMAPFNYDDDGTFDLDDLVVFGFDQGQADY
ncbi:hypothetical protein SETIT_3G287100v2 [Setaria italica]|uniref:WRKY domain-containing protein n=1 Tax=Setaria italica TaxID=4555 RepID=K3Z832_SETIT|nr:probable WRKY transcription factor 70 [Setaria italica]RCV18273.1 hypothetical protein SETIT_3G287100v2 [Setaria italica]